MFTLRDLNVDAFVDALPTFTDTGREALRDRLSTPLTDAAEISGRQQEIRLIRGRIQTVDGARKKVQGLRARLQAAEAHVKSVADAKLDTRNAEYYSQILWDGDSWLYSWLNEVDWIQELVVLFRTLLLPGAALLMPFILVLTPILVLSMRGGGSGGSGGSGSGSGGAGWSWSEYWGMLREALQKAMPTAGVPRFGSAGGPMDSVSHVFAALFMFVASIWAQVSAALSMSAVVSDMRIRSAALRDFAEATIELDEVLGQHSPMTEIHSIAKNPLQTLARFGGAWNRPEEVKRLLTHAGHLDMLAAIALARKTCFPEILSKPNHGLVLQSVYHPGIPVARRVYNTVRMGMGAEKPHALLTGPNRGGKTTLLKAIGGAVLMSQTVGIVFARKAALPVFDNIVTALEPRDHLGALSLFESEIEFAKQVRGLPGRTFLMMDEIFHGTNAHDGVEASQVFLDPLFNGVVGAGVYSIISTHYMELPERYKERVQNLCMESSLDPVTKSLRYSYRVRPGVNCHSSVHEILRERGLLAD